MPAPSSSRLPYASRTSSTPIRRAQGIPTTNKARPFVIAVSVAAVTIMGTMYGAGLKQEAQTAKREETRAAESLAKKTERLQMARERLETTKAGLEKKIAELRARKETRALQQKSDGGV